MNVDLMRKTMNYIKEHPDEWNQTYYSCGTGFCFAGHAAILSGAEWDNTNIDHTLGGNSWFLDGEGKLTDFSGLHISEYTRYILGLDEDQSKALFSVSNNRIEVLEEIMEWIIANPNAYNRDLEEAVNNIRMTNA